MTATLSTTAGPLNVLRATVREPLQGAWTADVVVDADTGFTGAAILEVDGVRFVGTVRRGALEHGRYLAQMVGGAGGLGRELSAQNYTGTFLQQVIDDLLTATGETLSPDVSAGLLSEEPTHWSRRAGRAGLSLTQVAEGTAAQHWRVLRDGTVWIGAETWPAVSADYEYTEISREPSQGTATLAPDDGSGLVRPGQSWTDAAGLARNVATVVTTVDPGSVRQTLSLQDIDGGSVADRTLGPFRRMVEATVGRRIDYARMYACRVDGQNGDGSLDLTPDDSSIAADGFTSVPLHVGIPGVSVTVSGGGRVNLYFENGDPKHPRAALWPDGSSVETITFSGGSEPYFLSATFLSAFSTWINAVQAGVAATAAPGTNAAAGLLTTATTALDTLITTGAFESATIFGE